VNKYEAGLYGQKTAEDYLISKGYVILERNFRTRTGEIDIIAREEPSGYIVFAEIKYRADTGYGFPREAVGITKQQKIIETAMHYIAINESDNCDFRFDVIEVLGKELCHIENAFGV